MTILYISELKVHQDDLGRYVTTLTQEVMVKVNQAEETMFLDTLKFMDEGNDYIEYNRNDEELDVLGVAVNKAIECVNGLTGHTLIAPITEIKNDQLYKVELEY